MFDLVPKNVKQQNEAVAADFAAVNPPSQEPEQAGDGNSVTESATSKINVLIVDDQLIGRRIMTELLHSLDEPLSVHSHQNPEDALQYMQATIPDLIITDYKMPQMDGIQFTKRIRQLTECRDVPVVMVTVCEDRHVRYKALEAGVNDFLVRPLDKYECKVRCQNLLSQRKQQRSTKTQLGWLEQKALNAAQQVRSLEHELLLRLARAGGYRDEITASHVLRMAKYARLIAEGLGLTPAACEEIELAAPMHDIGKIGIPDDILLKPGKLSEGEIKIMREHVHIGYEILKGSSSQYMQLGAIVALNHHEKYDGTGYPAGLQGEQIPVIARIVAVADVFDALTSARPYKDPWSIVDAVAYLQENTGSHFDPVCVAAFIERIDEAEKIKQVLS